MDSGKPLIPALVVALLVTFMSINAKQYMVELYTKLNKIGIKGIEA